MLVSRRSCSSLQVVKVTESNSQSVGQTSRWSPPDSFAHAHVALFKQFSWRRGMHSTRRSNPSTGEPATRGGCSIGSESRRDLPFRSASALGACVFSSGRGTRTRDPYLGWPRFEESASTTGRPLCPSAARLCGGRHVTLRPWIRLEPVSFSPPNGSGSSATSPGSSTRTRAPRPKRMSSTQVTSGESCCKTNLTRAGGRICKKSSPQSSGPSSALRPEPTAFRSRVESRSPTSASRLCRRPS
jgi:hypothetical protein